LSKVDKPNSNIVSAASINEAAEYIFKDEKIVFKLVLLN